MSNNKAYLQMNLKKLEKMNLFLGVKKREASKGKQKKNRENEFQLDSLHKRLIALPEYDSRQDTHLHSHFHKRGINKTMLKTGVVDPYSITTRHSPEHQLPTQYSLHSTQYKYNNYNNNYDTILAKRNNSVINSYNHRPVYTSVQQLENFYQNQVMQEQKAKELTNYYRGINKANNTDQIVQKMEKLKIEHSIKMKIGCVNNNSISRHNQHSKSSGVINKKPSVYCNPIKAQLTRGEFGSFLNHTKQQILSVQQQSSQHSGDNNIHNTNN